MEISVPLIGCAPSTAPPVAEKLSQTVSETMVETSKAQTYHWNVTGMAFGPLHAPFQEIYEDHYLAPDVSAERSKAIGSYAEGQLTQALANNAIKESGGAVAATDIVRDLTRDQKTLSRTRLDTVRVSEEHEYLVTNDLGIEWAKVHDKFAWMLRAHLVD